MSVVNVGTTPNDGTGDDLRTAFAAINAKFTAVDAQLTTPNIIDVSDAAFGLVGDGSTDNTTALATLNTTLRGYGLSLVRVIFPEGTYCYTRGDWLRGVRNVIIDAWGAQFKNTRTGSTNARMYPLLTNSNMFNDTAYGSDYDNAATHHGYLISTAASGAASVVTVTAAEAANFTAGDPVFVYGHAQQINSTPPNARYFEWNEVSSVNSGTGTITLKWPLQHDYDSAWWDFSTGKGAPRIINLNRPAYKQGRYLEINGAEFLASPGVAAPNNGAVVVDGYDHAVLRGCRGYTLYPTCCRKIEIIGGSWEYAETDKLIDEMIYDGAQLTLHTAAQAVNMLRLRDTRVLTGPYDFGARNVVIDGGVVSSTGTGLAASDMIRPNQGGIPINSVRVDGLRAIVRNSAAVGVLSSGIETSFTVASVSSNTKVLVTCADDTAAETLLKTICVGFDYRLQDGSKRVTVRKIYKDGATSMAIEGEFSSAPLAAEVYRGNSVRAMTIGAIEQSGTYAPIKIFNNSGNVSDRVDILHAADRDGRSQSKVFTEDDIPRSSSGGAAAIGGDFFLRARLLRIVVCVTKAYTGASGTCSMDIQARTPGVTTFATIDLKTTGTREITWASAGTPLGADSGFAATAAAFVDSLRLTMRSSGVFPTYSDVTELPKFEVLIETLRG